MNRFTRPIKPIAKNPLTVIILAAGDGRRINTYGPRQLWPYPHTKVPIIEQQIVISQEFTNYSVETIVVVGYSKEKIYEKLTHLNNVRFVENNNWENTGPVESLRLGLLAAKNNPVLVMYNDIIFSKSLFNDVHDDKSTVFVDQHNLFGAEEIGVKSQNGRVVSLRYDWPTKWTGITLCRDKELSLLRKHCNELTNRRKNVGELLNDLIDDGANFTERVTKDKIYEIDSYKEYTNAMKVII